MYHGKKRIDIEVEYFTILLFLTTFKHCIHRTLWVYLSSLLYLTKSQMSLLKIVSLKSLPPITFLHSHALSCTLIVGLSIGGMCLWMLDSVDRTTSNIIVNTSSLPSWLSVRSLWLRIRYLLYLRFQNNLCHSSISPSIVILVLPFGLLHWHNLTQ